MYAQIFGVLGLRDTVANPAQVTHNVFEGVYFTVMTWTTVGYGDLVPSGAPARFFAALAALNGYALLAVLIAYLIPVLSSASLEPSIVSLFDFEEQHVRQRRDKKPRQPALSWMNP